ncbi:MAG: ABC transporter ATP-binding protein [Actinomycetota bacterium]
MTTNGRPALEVRDLSIRFGGVEALRSVNLRVMPETIVGLIGPNGAGKTTLFNCVGGFYRPDTGVVRFHGHDVARLGPHRRALLGMGRTFQNVGLCKDQTVYDNLVIAQHRAAAYPALAGMFGLGTRGIERDIAKKADDLLELVGLTAHRNHRIDELSAGLMRIAELACTLSAQPTLLLLDEPAAGLSPEATDRMRDVLLRIRRESRVSILMIGHVMRLVMNVADYVYVLNFGELLAEGTPDEIRANEAVVEAYMGREAEQNAGSWR